MFRIFCFGLAVLLCACGSNDNGHIFSDIGSGSGNPTTAQLFSFAPDGPYAEVLVDCVSAETVAQLCSLSTLPLMGQEIASPSVNEIMNRVVVDHAWMATRFQQALALLPPDLLSLFKGVTAVVIASDVRPSFYSGGTAAIYLDPAYLWLTNAEKATISRQDDFRSDFGSELQFLEFWRYVKNNDYAYDSYSLDGNETRGINDILLPLARLLYHELAHANDLIPPSQHAVLLPQMTPLDAITASETESTSFLLDGTAPLTSLIWTDLAQVLYFGETATASQKTFSADFVGDEFSSDGASDPYAYSNSREDVAMLFEEAMMKYHFDIDRDIAFLPDPAFPLSCADYIVKWGVRNRIGDEPIRTRAALVAAELLPDTDLSGFFATLPASTPMVVDQDWCQNLVLGGTSPLQLAPPVEVSPTQLRRDGLPPEY